MKLGILIALSAAMLAGTSPTLAQGAPAELLPAFTAEMIRLGDLDDLADLAG